MARRKPIPLGPGGHRDAIGHTPIDVRNALAQDAYVSWTKVIRSAAEGSIAPTEHVALEAGRAVRDVLQTWSYKRHQEVPERYLIALALRLIADGKLLPPDESAIKNAAMAGLESPIKNLSDKVSGRKPITFVEGVWLLAAVVANWGGTTSPATNSEVNGGVIDQAFATGVRLLRFLVTEKIKGIDGSIREELLKCPELTEEYATKDKKERMIVNQNSSLTVYNFSLTDDVDVPTLLDDVSKRRGAWIAASSDTLFIESDLTDSVSNFAMFAEKFAEPPTPNSSILIFVMDGGFISPDLVSSDIRRKRTRVILNWASMSAAMTTFSLLGSGESYPENQPDRQARLRQWTNFTKRTCFVFKDFVHLSGGSLKLATGTTLDDTVRSKCGIGLDDFEPLPTRELRPSIERSSVLPNDLPSWAGTVNQPVSVNLGDEGFHHWTVTVDASAEGEQPSVEYFVAPKQNVFVPQDKSSLAASQTSARQPKTIHISGGFSYVRKCKKPKKLLERNRYDQAQILLYQAACARLKYCGSSSEEHAAGLDALAQLRQIGVEVFPADIAMTMMNSLTWMQTTRANCPK